MMKVIIDEDEVPDEEAFEISCKVDGNQYRIAESH
jgi:hypothetical protein